MRRVLRSRVLRLGFPLVAVTLLVWAVIAQWPNVRDALADLSWQYLVFAELAVLVAMFMSLLSWRVILADMGSPLALRPAVQIFFIGQLGKYIPGSVWPVVAQMELGADHGVPRRSSAAAAGVMYVVNVITAGIVFAISVPLVETTTLSVVLAAAGMVAGAVLLWPPVLNRLIATGLRRLGRPQLDRPLSGPGVIRSLAWGVAAWVFFGLHVVVLAVGSGASLSASLLVTCVGGYALAWVTGFLVVLAPAGAGVREATLSLALRDVLPAGAALAVALVSRLLVTVGDLVWGLVGMLLIGSRRLAMIRADARGLEQERAGVPPGDG